MVKINISAFCLKWVALYFKALLNSIEFYKRLFLHVTPVQITVSWSKTIKIPKLISVEPLNLLLFIIITNHLKLLFVHNFFKKSIKIHSSLSFMLFCFVFRCRSLSKSFVVFKTTSLTSKPLSKDVKISWVINRGLFMQESPGLNPDCFRQNKLLSKMYFNMISYIICFETLLQIGRSQTRWKILLFCLLPFLNIETMFPFS